MSLFIKNLTASPVVIDDLGITLPSSGTLDLSTLEASSVYSSSLTDGDLFGAVTGSPITIVALDPLDDTTELSSADSLTILRLHNDTHYRIRGGELNQLDDVLFSGSPPISEGEVFTFSGGMWTNAPRVDAVGLEDEGSTVTGGPHSTLDFVGGGVSVVDAGSGKATITIPAGNTLVIKDEGSTVTGGPHGTLNFVGSSVTVTDAGGGEATVTITGGGGGGIEQKYFHGHNGTTTQTFSALTTINFGTNVRSDANYTAATVVGGTEVTINTTGWYKISFEVTANTSTGSTAVGQHDIQVNGTNVSGGRARSFHGKTNGSSTTTAEIIRSMTAGQVVRVRSSVTTGSGIVTIAQGCRLNIESIDGP